MEMNQHQTDGFFFSFRFAAALGLTLLVAMPAFSATTAKAQAKKKKPSLASSAPNVSPNANAMFRALQFAVYEKGTGLVSDVSGLFDSKTQKITLKCQLKNRTQKEIHAVRGTLRFSTFFGETIGDIYLETTATIPPGQTAGVNWTVGTERLNKAAFEKIKKMKLDQMKQIWMPRMIVFTDGTTLQ
jgi:hypothetical protein